MTEIVVDHEKLASLIARQIGVTPEYLSPEQAATYSGIPAKTLEQWRRTGDGPPFAKVGRHVRYRRSDIDKFFAERRVSQCDATMTTY